MRGKKSDVNLSVQDFHRLHFEIVTSAAASIPKEVRTYPERGSGPVSQAHLERGLRLDLLIYRTRTLPQLGLHKKLFFANKDPKTNFDAWMILQKPVLSFKCNDFFKNGQF